MAETNYKRAVFSYDPFSGGGMNYERAVFKNVKADNLLKLLFHRIKTGPQTFYFENNVPADHYPDGIARTVAFQGSLTDGRMADNQLDWDEIFHITVSPGIVTKQDETHRITRGNLDGTGILHFLCLQIRDDVLLEYNYPEEWQRVVEIAFLELGALGIIRQTVVAAEEGKESRNVAEAMAEYQRMIERGEEPAEKSALFDFVKQVSRMGGGDFGAGMKLLNKQIGLTPLELSVIETIVMPEAEFSAVAAVTLETTPEKTFRNSLPAIVQAKGRMNPPAQTRPEPKADERTLPKRWTPRQEKLNKLAIEWAELNQTGKEKDYTMEKFLQDNVDYGDRFGLVSVTVSEFKDHLPKACRWGVINKSKSGRFIPKTGN